MTPEEFLAMLLEKAVRLGATANGAQALTEYKKAFWAHYGTWTPKKK